MAIGDKIHLLNKEEVQGAMGNINNPLLDMPLNNSLSMKQGVGNVTFTRSTTATYIDRYGVLKTAAIDEPRFEKDGLLIEGSSTNLLTDSNSNFAPTGVTITENNVSSPDGTTTAHTLVGDGDSSEHYTQKLVTVADDTSTYTVSIYVKKGTADAIAYRTYLTGGTSVSSYNTFTFSTETITGTGTVVKLSDGWYRITNTITNNASGNTTLYNRCYVDGGGITTSTDTLYAYGMQSEKLPFASSYIPTTDAAVTRVAEYLYASGYTNYYAPVSSIIIDHKALGVHIYDQYLFRVAPSDEFNVIIKRASGALDFYNTDRIQDLQFNDADIGKFSRTCVTTGDSIHIYSDGVLHVTGTASPYSPIPTEIYIGGRDSTTLSYYGHIKNFRIYDRELTPTEVALV